MSVAIVFSRALSGMQAPLVRVEVHLANGLPAFNLVGLPETEVKESRECARAALQNAQFVEAEFWLNLQTHHDLVHAREVLADRLAPIKPLPIAA